MPRAVHKGLLCPGIRFLHVRAAKILQMHGVHGLLKTVRVKEPPKIHSGFTRIGVPILAVYGITLSSLTFILAANTHRRGSRA